MYISERIWTGSRVYLLNFLAACQMIGHRRTVKYRLVYTDWKKCNTEIYFKKKKIEKYIKNCFFFFKWQANVDETKMQIDTRVTYNNTIWWQSSIRPWQGLSSPLPRWKTKQQILADIWYIAKLLCCKAGTANTCKSCNTMTDGQFRLWPEVVRHVARSKIRHLKLHMIRCT